jgi:hypothetical protein
MGSERIDETDAHGCYTGHLGHACGADPLTGGELQPSASAASVGA